MGSHKAANRHLGAVIPRQSSIPAGISSLVIPAEAGIQLEETRG